MNPEHGHVQTNEMVRFWLALGFKTDMELTKLGYPKIKRLVQGKEMGEQMF